MMTCIACFFPRWFEPRLTEALERQIEALQRATIRPGPTSVALIHLTIRNGNPAMTADGGGVRVNIGSRLTLNAEAVGAILDDDLPRVGLPLLRRP